MVGGTAANRKRDRHPVTHARYPSVGTSDLSVHASASGASQTVELHDRRPPDPDGHSWTIPGRSERTLHQSHTGDQNDASLKVPPPLKRPESSLHTAPNARGCTRCLGLEPGARVDPRRARERRETARIVSETERSGDVAPCPAGDHAADRRRRHAVLVRKAGLRDAVRRRVPNRSDRLDAEPRRATPSNVLCARDRLKVVRIHATAVRTRVIKFQPGRDWPFRGLVARPVRHDHPSPGADQAVAVPDPCPSPFVAAVRLHGVSRTAILKRRNLYFGCSRCHCPLGLPPPPLSCTPSCASARC